MQFDGTNLDCQEIRGCKVCVQRKLAEWIVLQ
jgi:hypothetical protein